MRKLPLLIASSTFAVLLFAACGGGDPVQGPTEAGVPVELDFSAIAGTWSGWAIEPREGQGTDIQFWASLDLNSSAPEGVSIGTIEEGMVRGTTICVANALAMRADDPVYTVEEIVTSGGCPDAIVRLEHDPEAGTLTVDWTAGNITASGVMRRGSDPGPRP